MSCKKRGGQNVLQRAVQVDTRCYSQCIEASKRIRWDIDKDVMRERQLDFSKKFLPDGLSRVHQLEFLSEEEQKLSRTERGPLGERRKLERIPIIFRATFGATLAGLREGKVTEATMSECRLESHVLIPVNTYLELWLQTSLTAPRIFVELALSGWVREGRCGLGFLSLRPEDRLKLQEIIEDIERPS
jgi:hypothetical protein